MAAHGSQAQRLLPSLAGPLLQRGAGGYAGVCAGAAAYGGMRTYGAWGWRRPSWFLFFLFLFFSWVSPPGSDSSYHRRF